LNVDDTKIHFSLQRQHASISHASQFGHIKYSFINRSGT